MTKTIQEQLAEQPHTGDPQLVQYVGTVEAYDKWAEVCAGANARNNFSMQMKYAAIDTTDRFMTQMEISFNASTPLRCGLCFLNSWTE